MYLPSYKAEVFDTLQSLQQQLKNCRSSNIWKQNAIRFGDNQGFMKHWLGKALHQISHLINYAWPDKTGLISLSGIAKTLYLLWQKAERLLGEGCHVRHLREMYEQAVSLLPAGHALQLPLLDTDTFLQARWEKPALPNILAWLRGVAVRWVCPKPSGLHESAQQLALSFDSNAQGVGFSPLALTLRQARKIAGMLGVRQKVSCRDLSLDALREAIAAKVAVLTDTSVIEQVFAIAGVECRQG